jgi:LacI family transcriptional regulator, galactose operon repressor
MRRAVMTAVEELGYRPDMLAQGLRSGKTFSVGFTVSDISNPVLADVVTGAEKRLRDGGYSLLLTNSEGNAELDAEQISLLQRRRVDGLILSLADENHPSTVAALREVSVPAVIVDRDVPEGSAARCVAFDHAAGMRVAVEHVLALGHRDLALIIGGPQRPARERRRGVEEAVAGYGSSAHCTLYEGDFVAAHGRWAVKEILSKSPRPTAVIAGGNMLMQGALLELRESGQEVGRDISFVGCDDVALAELHRPPIAVVYRDARAAGVCAAELLLAALAGDDSVADIMLPTTFIARPSCAPPPT